LYLPYVLDLSEEDELSEDEDDEISEESSKNNNEGKLNKF